MLKVPVIPKANKIIGAKSRIDLTAFKIGNVIERLRIKYVNAIEIATIESNRFALLV